MNKQNENKPLAERMRPQNLEDFLGQKDIVGKDKLLSEAISSDVLPSMIFWGPPGSGKTTLAFIISQNTKSYFKQISAVESGKKDLLAIVKEAQEKYKEDGKKSILFVDEIHRWNKIQQDALLPFVEKGDIILIGATTENPSFEIRSALLSRCRVFVLKKLKKEHIQKIITKTLKDKEKGLGKLKLKASDEIIEIIAEMSKGDARKALNIIEYASKTKSGEITLEIVKDAVQKSHLMYDKNGDEYYNLISALHKSMRGSDADASLYWLGRMLEAGEEPLRIARRLIRFASEDIGLANSRALEQAVSAYQACHFVGMPECNVNLAQAVVYMAKCPKSNRLYAGYMKVQKDIEQYGNLEVPLHIRNAPTKLMKNLGYGKNYKYGPDHDYKEKQEYLPEKLKSRKYI